MLDGAELRHWYRHYLLLALGSDTHSTRQSAKCWARAMSLIAEQLVAYDGADEKEGSMTHKRKGVAQ